jgi:hypothetical protein
MSPDPLCPKAATILQAGELRGAPCAAVDPPHEGLDDRNGAFSIHRQSRAPERDFEISTHRVHSNKN